MVWLGEALHGLGLCEEVLDVGEGDLKATLLDSHCDTVGKLTDAT